MMNLTFGEQVKIILSRKGMTIKQLAEEMEKHTGKPMSRQNMTQRLGRDNFQEQDMRMIAEILGCNLTLSIIPEEKECVVPEAQESAKVEKVTESSKIPLVQREEEKEILRKGIKGYIKKTPIKQEKTPIMGEVNPYTGREYETNSVRIHPKKIGYVQVYDRKLHDWTEMTEWGFLGYQDRLKQQLGKDYKEPIYLD